MPTADWTWDDLLTYAQAMTDQAKGQWGRWRHRRTRLLVHRAFIHGAAASVLNADYNKCTLTEPPAIEACSGCTSCMFTRRGDAHPGQPHAARKTRS